MAPLLKENAYDTALYNRFMGRGEQRREGDAFTKVLGTRRGSMRPEDAFVLGLPSFDPHLEVILGDIEERGDRREAVALFETHHSQLTPENPHVQALLTALAEQGVCEEIGNWEFSAQYEAIVLRTTKRGRSPGMALYAKKIWERTARARAIETLKRDVKRDGTLKVRAAARNACRTGMVAAFAEQCHREEPESLLRLGGPRPELERVLGTWPPKRGLDTFWGLGDWQYLLAEGISKRALSKLEVTLAQEDVSSDVSVSTDQERERKQLAQDIRSALRQAERRGSPRELLISA